MVEINYDEEYGCWEDEEDPTSGEDEEWNE